MRWLRRRSAREVEAALQGRVALRLSDVLSRRRYLAFSWGVGVGLIMAGYTVGRGDGLVMAFGGLATMGIAGMGLLGSIRAVEREVDREARVERAVSSLDRWFNGRP